MVPSEERITSGNAERKNDGRADGAGRCGCRRNSCRRRKVWRRFETEAHCAELLLIAGHWRLSSGRRASAGMPRRRNGESNLQRRVKPVAPPPVKPAPKPDAAPADEIRRRRDQRSFFERPQSDRDRRAAQGGSAETDAAAACRVYGVHGLAERNQGDHGRESRAQTAGRFRRETRSANSRSSRSIRRTSPSTGTARILAQDRGPDRPVRAGAGRECAAGRSTAAPLPRSRNSNQPAPPPAAAPTTAKDLGVEVGAPGQASSRACAPGDHFAGGHGG